MKTIIVEYLPWLLSFVSILVQYLAGNKNKTAWMISIPLQILWLIWICLSGSWGFIPLNFSMTAISIRNLLKWMKDDLIVE